MRGASAVLGGLLIITVMISSLSAITILYEKTERSMERKANYYGSQIVRELYLKKLTKRIDENGVSIYGIEPEDLKKLIILKDNGEVVITRRDDIALSGGKLYIPAHLLENAKVFLLMSGGVAIDLDSLREPEKREGQDLIGISRNMALFLSLLSRFFEAVEFYNMARNSEKWGEPESVEMILPLSYTLKVENASILIYTTPEGCSDGKVRILYWEAIADYMLEISFSGASLYYERGTLQFTRSDIGVYTISKTFPTLNNVTQIAYTSSVFLMNLYIESYIELVARNTYPPDYCSNMFIFTPPTIRYIVMLNMTLHLPNGTKAVSIVPEIQDLWSFKAGGYSETTKLYGFDKNVQSLYLYMEKETIMALYSYIYATGLGGGTVKVEGVPIRLMYSKVFG